MPDDASVDLGELLSDDEAAQIDREFSELVARLEAEPPEVRLRRKRRPRRYRPRPPIHLTCCVCGSEFVASRRDARYCGTPCRVTAWKERQARRRRAAPAR